MLNDSNKARKRLEEANFSDLNAMMEAYAAAAANIARDQFRQHLDFTSESMVAFEAVLSELAEKDDLDYEYEVKLWGGYLGEVLRRRYNGAWEMTQYPGGAAAVPAVEIRGSRLFPLIKVYRRLTMGDSESIGAFFHMVTERLGQPARVN
ncbi:hypothetical protein ACFPT7_03630 [Acidicapsa dinghuensis]|uniref:DUF3806 domain-containing protein n=1 Tax=Acidicapsa dinghuensis TaxID=2218256 RepID=A0ABW1EBL2_9BACT|nr:hypothetical protein [Acidicapsa dinghuensis]